MSTTRIIEIDTSSAGASGAPGEADALSAIADRAFAAHAGPTSRAARPAIAVVSGPPGRSELVQVSATMSGARASAAAGLAIEHAAAPGDELVWASQTLWTDPDGVENARHHLMALALPAASIGDIARVAAAHRFFLRGVVPRESLVMREAVDALRGQRDSLTVLLWVDRAGTALAIADGPRLAIVRHIPIGTDAIAEMLARVTPSADAKPIGLAVARQWLDAVGVPAPEDVIPVSPGIRGSAMLPAIEPALQRLAMEVRQSLRFAVGEARRASARLRLSGLHVRGLGEAISFRTGTTLDPERPGPAATRSVQQAALRSARDGILLRSRAWREVRARSVWRAALAGGAAVVLGLGVLDWQDATRRRDAALAALSDLQSGAENPPAADVAVAAQARRARAADHAARWLSSGQPYSSTLTALAQATPPGITLVSIELGAGSNGVHTVRGVAGRADDADPTQHIRDYVERLRAVPVIAGVSLDAVRREFRDDQEVHAFDLTIELLELPAPALRLTSEVGP